MKMPKAGSTRFKIMEKFVEFGAMTVDEFMEKHLVQGVKSRRHLANFLYEMEIAEYLTQDGNVFSAKENKDKPVAVKSVWKSKLNLVQPRTVAEFLELSDKHLLPKLSPRGQPLREISFIGLGASIVEPYCQNYHLGDNHYGKFHLLD